ncbi:unnamed protein product [Rotaria sp. Silwood2]|nr:unnamed protein product [Rotaria sp. Silwood2]
MKGKYTQTAVKNKFESSNGPTKDYRDLGEEVSLTTTKVWDRMIENVASINLSYPTGHQCTIRAKGLNMITSRTNAWRALRDGLSHLSCKKIKQTKLTDLQKKEDD